MPKKEESMCMCHQGYSWKMLVVGLLILANAYWSVMGWGYFVGGLAVIGGLLKMFMPCKCK